MNIRNNEKSKETPRRSKIKKKEEYQRKKLAYRFHLIATYHLNKGSDESKKSKLHNNFQKDLKKRES